MGARRYVHAFESIRRLRVIPKAKRLTHGLDDRWLLDIHHEVLPEHRNAGDLDDGDVTQATHLPFIYSERHPQLRLSFFEAAGCSHHHFLDFSHVHFISVSFTAGRKIYPALIMNPVRLGQAVWHSDGEYMAIVQHRNRVGLKWQSFINA